MSVVNLQGTMQFKFLLDAYEQRGYAEFQRSFGKGTIDFCALTPPNADHTACNSEEQYSAFVARYME
jgi:hypothetical protein